MVLSERSAVGPRAGFAPPPPINARQMWANNRFWMETQNHAPLKHLRAGRHLFTGHWHHAGMQGITNTGAGTSGIPIRFNTNSEILALRLVPG